MQTLELRHGAMRLALRPDLGGCIAGLWLGDVPVLRSTPPADLHNVRLSASYPLAPFSNRMAHAQLLWNGTGHPLVQNAPGEAHAIHGVVWQRPWAVLETGVSHAVLCCEHRADKAWPFAFDCSQAFHLSDAGLEMTLSITNQSHQPAPVGLGWHPYFVKRAHSRISFEAAGRWEMGADRLPTEHRASNGLDADCASLDSDHCFDGWTGTVHLHDDLLHTRITSDLRRLVVFTNDTKDFVAIEPVSHVNNAVNMLATNPQNSLASRLNEEKLGVKVLSPGESWSVQMALQTVPVP